MAKQLNFGHYWHSAWGCVKFSHIKLLQPWDITHSVHCWADPCPSLWGLCSSVTSVLLSGYPILRQCLELFYTALPPEGKLLEMWFWGTWLTVEHFTVKANRMNSLIFIPEKLEFHYKTVYIKLFIKHLRCLLESKRPSGTIPRNCLNHLRPCLLDIILP